MENKNRISFTTLLKWSAYLFITIVIALLGSNIWIIKSTSKQLYSDINSIPSNKVGILLGASRKLPSGYDNLFFKYRIEAAADLYKAGKIKHIIVSGDNHKKNMMKLLICAMPL